MTVILETAGLQKYYKIQFGGEKPPGSHGKKKAAMQDLRATLEMSELLKGRVPGPDTLDKWLDDEVCAYKAAKKHVDGQQTGDGDDDEDGEAVHTNTPYEEALRTYVLAGIKHAKKANQPAEAKQRDEAAAKNLEAEAMRGRKDADSCSEESDSELEACDVGDSDEDPEADLSDGGSSSRAAPTKKRKKQWKKHKKGRATTPSSGARDEKLFSAIQFASTGLNELAQARKDEAAARKDEAAAQQTAANAQLLSAQNQGTVQTDVATAMKTMMDNASAAQNQQAQIMQQMMNQMQQSQMAFMGMMAQMMAQQPGVGMPGMGMPGGMAGMPGMHGNVWPAPPPAPSPAPDEPAMQ